MWSMLALVGNLAMSAAVAAPAAPVPAPTPAQIQAAIDAADDPRGQTTYWRSDAIGVILGYDERWSVRNASQPNTAVVINWVTRRDDKLMATCYVEATKDSDVARLTPKDVEVHARDLVDSMMANGRKRDPEMTLVSWRLARQDNHPVVYLERDARFETLDDVREARTYSIITAWRGYEVVVECASPIPRGFPEMAPVVELPIKRILNSVQFMR